jgi:hypothetical protein
LAVFAPPILFHVVPSFDLCHWYVKAAVPVAVTLNAAEVPAVTVLFYNVMVVRNGIMPTGIVYAFGRKIRFRQINIREYRNKILFGNDDTITGSQYEQ